MIIKSWLCFANYRYGKSVAKLVAAPGTRWNGQQLIPRWWLELATRSSQELNPDYGYTFWVNSNGTHWPGLPTDMFALEGHNTNRCYVLPSLDLVVVQVGAGPARWNEQDFVSGVVASILPE